MLLATGAQERPVPVPGWTLPNVLTAGAASIRAARKRIRREAREVLRSARRGGRPGDSQRGAA